MSPHVSSFGPAGKNRGQSVDVTADGRRAARRLIHSAGSNSRASKNPSRCEFRAQASGGESEDSKNILK
jgi:hypothetical protein